METVQVATFVETDGEVRFANVPCHKGDRVEGVITVLPAANDAERRAEAITSFLEHARHSSFYSTRPYPSRDELHERG